MSAAASIADAGGLCLGGNVFGWTADELGSFAVLDAAHDAGIRFVDTADVYSAWVDGHEGGESEAIIGRWLAARRGRELTIATKVGMRAPDDDLRPATTRRACEGSLRRLGVEAIDLYYAHQDDDGDLAEALAGFDALVREGKVRWVGLSNFSAARLREALEVCERDGLARPVAVQPGYSLVKRGYEDEEQGVVAEAGLACFPYYALASGFLTGKYRPGGTDVGSPRAPRAAQFLKEPRGPRILEALDEVAAAHDVPVASVALAWLRSRETVQAPIASARTVEQVAPLAASLDLALSEQELARLTAASDA